MQNKYNSEVDVAVLLLFFTRTEITKRTFEQIRKARPARLYLYQDGPRVGRQDDVENVAKCRETIESMIDWDCEVHRKYQENNYGCDPSEYISQKWMFETETKGIIIEDDDAMSVSFFRFCKELLDKYENDDRINMICGMNHLGVYEECPYDYFFNRVGGAIWGWATWKRVVDKWDPDYGFLQDPYALKSLESEFGKKTVDNLVQICRRHKATGREHYETIHGMGSYLSGTLNIIPKRNMTCNIGVGVDSTHTSEYHKLTFRSRRNLFMRTYELEFPLSHPKYIQTDKHYWDLVECYISNPKIVQIFRLDRFEHLIYSIFPSIGKWVTRFEKDKQF